MDDTSKKKIHFLIYYESIYQCSPWINSIYLFLEKKHSVNVYQQERRYIKHSRFSAKKNLRLFEYQIPYLFDFVLRALMKISSWIAKIGVVFPRAMAIRINNYFRMKSFIWRVLGDKSEFSEGDIVVAGDPIALYAAQKISDRQKTKLVFWNLELYIESELIEEQLKRWKRLEKTCSAHADIVLEFGHQRKNILIKENNLSPERVLVIPNSPIGAGQIVRNNYFNKKFGIPDNKIIILSAGGISDISGTEDLLKAIMQLPEDYVLIFHSKVFSKGKFPNIPGRVYFNMEPLPYDQIDLIYSSCDIGIMIIKAIEKSFHTNHTYVDWSSGKLFSYMKFGKPVITNQIPGYKELIENNEIGFVAADHNEISAAAGKIMSDYKKYSENSIRVFEELKFEKYHDIFYNKAVE